MAQFCLSIEIINRLISACKFFRSVVSDYPVSVLVFGVVSVVLREEVKENPYL